jgi:hypothetical protein
MSDTTITPIELSTKMKRKREVPKTKSIKIRKFDEQLSKNTLFTVPTRKECIIFNVELNSNGKLKHILVVTKTNYYLKINIFTTNEEYNIGDDIDFSCSTRNLGEWEIAYCKNETEAVEKFVNFIFTSKIKNIITYNAESAERLNGYVKPKFVEEYLTKKYFLRSYDIDDIVFLFLNKKNKTNVERCITCAELLDKI